jgi:ABC-type spermidine/putrescine transport system permease subunit II
MVRVGLNPQLNALSTLFIAATAVLVIASQFFTRKKTT